ncbi:hypothetical protein CsSME_00040741 [Camellia sinensis var. sinensis]
MATITDAAATTNVGGDLNPGATGLPTPTVVTSVVNPGVTPAVLEGPFSRHERPKKFIGVLSEDPPVVAENEPDRQKVMALDTWKQIDYLCQNYVFNSLTDSLYSVFCSKSSTKELWESLDK